MRSLDELPKKLADTARKQHRTIHLNVLAASIMVTNCIIAYKEKNPDVNFKFVQNPSSMDYDLCITATLPRRNITANTMMLEEKFFLAVPASSPYADYDEIELSEVSEEGFIMMADTRPIRSICDQFCLEAGFSPDIVFESMNFESVRSLISAGLGVGFWPEYSWESAENSKNMVLLPIKSPECKRDLIITYNKEFSENPVAEEFYHFLMDYAMDCKDQHQKMRT
jgi:DNA-binding transcriptional LysR family regulator